MKLRGVLALLSATLGQAAINVSDGLQALGPALESDSDASPIANIDTYQPDQHDCPLPCKDFSNVHSWITYFSVDRLSRCKDPMLLQFSVTQALNDPSSNILLRACTLGRQNESDDLQAVPAVDNPKTNRNLVKQGPLASAPACAVAGNAAPFDVRLLEGAGSSNKTNVSQLLDGMKRFFRDQHNCNENFLFSYYKNAVAGVYIGAGLGKPTAESVLGALEKHLVSGVASNRIVAEICNENRHPTRNFGVVFDTTGNLSMVQEMAFKWKEGTCASGESLHSAGSLANIKIFDIAGASMNNTVAHNNTLRSAPEQPGRTLFSRLWQKLDTCRYIQVQAGDGCPSLAPRCGISGYDFTRFNPAPGFCQHLREGDYACCSEGTPYQPPKPDAPKPGPDGVCATHFIDQVDTCDTLAKANGITVDDIERFNKGKTWAWTECGSMLYGYNMCLSEGKPPMPPPQAGTQCGPLVPNTERPSDNDISLADLNPCPLKACCSNWGFCGVFPSHCDIHAPPGGSPGSKLPGFQNTCVSNCGNEIKQNSGPPATFQRVGYYESYSMERTCLKLYAKDATLDPSYTHIHWAFAEIDQQTWKPVIVDKHGQWKDFKALQGVKRIVSFGGWAYSTEPATYNIIRRAILENRELFASNLAQFVKDEGIDGVDIDWEYPGAPDILVDGKPIGQKDDGRSYYRFLTVLKRKMGDKSVSIAAPASFWYLQAFPIDQIAKVIDYIVYMTYDLHGQWDYGNVNAFDACPSGKCIRSHVNITETRNALSIITKAGVPNNKIFVGEASYGRSFHMADPNCWGPMCEFTGTRERSDAHVARCTATSGYIANAEIYELLHRGDGYQSFRDEASDTDIMLWEGDYVSYMTDATKDKRRNDWKKLNFAGTIDWAIDLRAFSEADFADPPRAQPGTHGCVEGYDHNDSDTYGMCEFACRLGVCPWTTCSCTVWGDVMTDFPKDNGAKALARDPLDVGMNQLCRFSCAHDFCPDQVCDKSPDGDDGDDNGGGDDGPKSIDEICKGDIKCLNSRRCYIYQDYRYKNPFECYNQCVTEIQKAQENKETANYGCVGSFPLDKPIPWYPDSVGHNVVSGVCVCNNPLVNEIFDTVMEAMAIIAEIGCFLIMSALHTILNVATAIFPEIKPLAYGLDAAAAAAQTYNYLYADSEDPAGAFEWWLSPCGDTSLVPDDFKKIFNIINQATDPLGSWRAPKGVAKHSGKRGDDLNPAERTRGKPSNKPGTGKPAKGGNNNNKPQKGKCKNPGVKTHRRVGGYTAREEYCDKNDITTVVDYVITMLTWQNNPNAVQHPETCLERFGQACYHYSSVIREHNKWDKLPCPQQAAAKKRQRGKTPAVETWYKEHGNREKKGDLGWLATQTVVNGAQIKKLTSICEVDEYPPAQLLATDDADFINGGVAADAQLVRFLPKLDNGRAGQMFKGFCLKQSLDYLTPAELVDKCEKAVAQHKAPPTINRVQKKHKTEYEIPLDNIRDRPTFTWAQWDHKPKPTDGIWDNDVCWPKAKTPKDPTFALLSKDAGQNAIPQGDKFKYWQQYDPANGNGV